MTIQKIGVVGAGTMGNGIAQTCAANDFTVTMQDISDDLLEAGIKKIEHSLDRLRIRDKISDDEHSAILSRIDTTKELGDLSESDLVIEAVTENMGIKTAIIKTLGEKCNPDTIIASNTSSLSLTALAGISNRPDKIIGMHFFNPVPLMKLVEIIRALQTSDLTYRTIESIVKKLGKEPVSVKDSPGFVVNRMLVPMINEAVFVLHEGLASAEEIDSAMMLGANHPIGPLSLADMIGIDVCLYVMNVLLEEFGDSKFRPCPLLKQMVDAGFLGRKSQKGFFDYKK